MTSNNNAQPDGNRACKRDDIHLLLVTPDRVGPTDYILGYMSDGSITELMPGKADATVTHASILVQGKAKFRSPKKTSGNAHGINIIRQALTKVTGVDHSHPPRLKSSHAPRKQRNA